MSSTAPTVCPVTNRRLLTQFHVDGVAKLTSPRSPSSSCRSGCAQSRPRVGGQPQTLAAAAWKSRGPRAAERASEERTQPVPPRVRTACHPGAAAGQRRSSPLWPRKRPPRRPPRSPCPPPAQLPVAAAHDRGGRPAPCPGPPVQQQPTEQQT